eukprot:TRINITY_DN2954_c0_g1_i1.p1 TRINITY_DN2954_c0_g1~~TRINITY_DN2954_c0_g1_i1.p1  ORF type:complete len:443 (+),score=72.22 TRINITY_DN2954_c0_g1_i1:221-1549(+)
MLFDNAKIFIELSDEQEKQKLKQILTKNGATVLDKTEDNNYFHVLDRSNWKRLQELQAKRVKIIGAKCVYDSVNLKKKLPDASKHPVFCRTLDGLKICCTSLSTAQRTETEEMVKYMNGSYSVELTSRTDYLVATEVGSPKYQVAVERGIPIVKPNWISSCFKQQSLQPLKEHLLPPFAGCIICVTNLSTSTRSTIDRLVTSYGGVYSADLTNSCTHLISPVPFGLKYKYASIWGTHVVTINWLLDSINAGGCLDPSKYVPNQATHSSITAWPSTSVVQRLGHFFPTLANRPAQAIPATALLRSTPKRAVSFERPSSQQSDLREQPTKRQKIVEEDDEEEDLPSDIQRNNSAIASEPTSLNQIPELFNSIIGLCDEFINRAIDASNVCTLLEQSDNTTPMVRTACLNFIVKEFDTIKKTKGYQQLREDLKDEIHRQLQTTTD